MFKKTLLSAAVVSASLLAAGTANAGNGTCLICTGESNNMYAFETLRFIDVNNGSAPVVIHDSNGGLTDFELEGQFGWGIPAGLGDVFHLRWDMTNAWFNGTIGTEDFELDNGSLGNLEEIAKGGEPGDSWVIVAVNTFLAPAQVDTPWTMDLDAGGSGLRALPNVNATVEYCIYDEADDALNQINPLHCANTTLFTQKQGLTVTKTLAPYDPIADVKCKGGSFKEGSYHDRTPAYSCFVHRYERPFGALEINTDWAAADDGKYSDPMDYMFLTGINKAYWEFSGPMEWVQSTDGGIQRVRLTDSGTTGCEGFFRNTYPSYPSASYPYDYARVDVNDLYPYDGNEATRVDNGGFARGDGNWTFCQDDPPPPYDHPLIPVVEKYVANLIMPQSGNTNITEDLNGIDRNGILLRAPILTDFEGADQRVVLVNRGEEQAEYRFEFTVEVKEGVTFEVKEKAAGVLNPGETCSLNIEDVVDFEGKPRGSAVIIIAGRSQDIDGAVMLVTDGTAVTTNMTPDEGYNSGVGFISLPPELED